MYRESELVAEEEAMPCPGCGRPLFTERFCPKCGAANPIKYVDESLSVEPSPVLHRRGGSRVRHPVIIGAGIAIMIIIASFFGNGYALSNMQFKIRDVSSFDFASLSSDVVVEACNPNAFLANFDRFSGVIYYRSSEFATMSVDGGTVMPYQSADFGGRIQLKEQTVSGLIFAFADAVQGRDTAYNEDDISLTMTIEGRILGIMPYSQTRDFTFSEFQQVMSAQRAGSYSC